MWLPDRIRLIFVVLNFPGGDLFKNNWIIFSFVAGIITHINNNIFKHFLFPMGRKAKKNSKNHNSSSSEEEYIGHYQEAPGYMKDNEDITHGYRINFNTPQKIFKTMFTLHNESVNIWTHFLPALFILFLIGYLLIFVGPTTLME